MRNFQYSAVNDLTLTLHNSDLRIRSVSELDSILNKGGFAVKTYTDTSNNNHYFYYNSTAKNLTIHASCSNEGHVYCLVELYLDETYIQPNVKVVLNGKDDRNIRITALRERFPANSQPLRFPPNQGFEVEGKFAMVNFTHMEMDVFKGNMRQAQFHLNIAVVKRLEINVMMGFVNMHIPTQRFT